MAIKPIEVFRFLKGGLNYIAMDKNFLWHAFDEPPSRDERAWNYVCCYPYELPINIDYTGDWKDSLFARPKV